MFEAALELVDREGAEAFSMRRLGQALGVEAMSLYTYVASRDEILDGVSELMVQALVNRPPAAGWQDAIRAFASGIRSVARTHPQAFLLVGMRPLKSEEALAPVEALLAILRAAGFEPLQAVAAYRLATAYARGFALAEIQGFTLDTGSERNARDTHPFVAEARGTLGALDHDAAFALGLEAIVTGLRGSVRPMV